MQRNKLIFTLLVAALLLAAILAWSKQRDQANGPSASQPQTYSFSGKIKSIDSYQLVVESFTVTPDPTGQGPARVETKDRTVEVSGRTRVFQRVLSGTEGQASRDEDRKLSDLAVGREIVVYAATSPDNADEIQAQSVEILN